MSKLRRNVSKLNKGEENSSIGIKENKIIHEQTQINNKKITLDKINQFNRTQSQMLPSFHKTKKIKKIRKIPKFQIESGKPHCLLYRIRKINPEINLNYQIELYQKKQRYSVTKKDEMIDESKHGRKFFERENFKEDYVYEPSLSNRLESNKFYLKNKKSISKGVFKSMISNMKESKNDTKFYYDFSGLFEDKDFFDDNMSTFFITNNKKFNTKYSTMANSVETSRPFSTQFNKEEIKNNYDYNNTLRRHKILYLKLKGRELRNKIIETYDQANNASLELSQNINFGKKYDKSSSLNNNNEKYFKKNYKKINDDKNKLKKYLLNCIESKKEHNKDGLPRNFQYLDKAGKRILIEARERDKYNQNFLNKNQSKKNFVLNSKFYVNKLISELNELGSDILATKKKFKGEDAIEPKNEKQFFHGLIKENLLKNLSDENYIEEIIKRKSVAESLNNKAEKRLFALKQRSLAMRHKVRSGDYNYL